MGHQPRVNVLIIYSKIVGWTALQFPWKIRPITEEMKAMANSHDLPPALDGMNMDALEAVFEMLGYCSHFGYNPDTDYRKELNFVFFSCLSFLVK
jgi:hypothetical protein